MYPKNVHLHTQAEDSLRHYALVTRCSFQGNGRCPACVLSGGSVSDVSAFQWKCLHDAEFVPPVNRSVTSKPGSSPLNTHVCDLNSLSQQPGPPSLEQWWPRANGLGVGGTQLWGHIPFPFLFSLATLGKVSRGPAPFPQMQNGELSVASGGRMIFR